MFLVEVVLPDMNQFSDTLTTNFILLQRICSRARSRGLHSYFVAVAHPPGTGAKALCHDYLVRHHNPPDIPSQSQSHNRRSVVNAPFWTV